MGNQDERQRADEQSGWVAENVLTVRPALSGRLLMSALAILPIVSIVANPDLAIVDVGVAVIIAFFAVALWRLHIYADTDVVAFRGGLNPQEVRRAQIAAIAFSTPLPLNVAFLGADGNVLLNVPIGATLPRGELVKLSAYLQVPLR